MPSVPMECHLHAALPARDPATILPRLRIEPPARSAHLPDEGRRPIRTWRDRHGRAAVYSYTEDGADCIHLPRLATFRLARLEEVTAIPLPDVPEERVREAYQRTVLPFAVQGLGFEILHASAVLTDGGVVAFCAHSGTGKSTVAYGLSQRGYTLWADDLVAFRARGSRVTTIRLPSRIRLRPESAGALGQLELSELRDCGERPEDGSQCGDWSHLAKLFVLRRVDGAGVVPPVRSRRPGWGEALAGVLKHAQSLSLDDAQRKHRLASQYLALISAVPVLELVFPSDFGQLSTVLDEIERAMS